MELWKKLVMTAVFCAIGMTVSANEKGFTFKPFFGGGGVTALFDFNSGYGLGGSGEFAFLFYDKGLQISNHILGTGSSINIKDGITYGTGSIMDKISFGGFLSPGFLRTYAFVEGGIGFSGGNETSARDILFGGGGGIDLFFHEKGSIYTELGYVQHYIDNTLMGGLSISIGTRGYW